LRIGERAHAEPRAARFVAGREAEAAGDPACAVGIECGRDAAGAERDDQPRCAAVRAEDRRISVALDRERRERCLRPEGGEPRRVVDARQPAAERALRPVEREPGARECVRARGRDRRPRTFDAEPQPRRAAAPLREFAPVPISSRPCRSASTARVPVPPPSMPIAKSNAVMPSSR